MAEQPTEGDGGQSTTFKTLFIRAENWIDRNLQAVRFGIFSLTAGSVLLLAIRSPLLVSFQPVSTCSSNWQAVEAVSTS